MFGIFKAYCTRVGAGPFPTELFDETGDKMCTLGHEFGSVTGRKRRCGWIDLVALKYSVMINGVTKLIMMKSDVLDTFDTIKACVAYKVDGEEIDYFPYDITEGVEPVYAELPGWKTDMTKMQSEDEFPEEFNAYLTFLEEQLGVEIKIVSVDRTEPRQSNVILKNKKCYSIPRITLFYNLMRGGEMEMTPPFVFSLPPILTITHYENTFHHFPIISRYESGNLLPAPRTVFLPAW